jgi:hypothetical protein
MKFEVFGIAFVAVALAACSSQPTRPSASAPPAAAPAGSGAAAMPNASGETPVLSRSLVSAGYKATTIKGEIYYCRMEDVTNTAFKRKVCLTEAQLKDQERKTKEMQDRMIRQQTNPGCSGSSCG